MTGVGGSVPPGTLRIDREGVWRHEGHEVTHPGVLRNLYANLRADAGVHYLQVGAARIPVEVDDTPFVVQRVEALAPAGTAPAFQVCLSDGTTERLDPESLWIGANQTPYCRVKGGRLTARLTVPAWLQLAPFVEEAPGTGQLTLRVGGQCVQLHRRPA